MNVLSEIKGRCWLILGLLSYFGAAISSIIRSFQPGGFSPPTGTVDIAYVCIEWFAACTIYFFLGALVGHVIDFIIARKDKKRITTPAWFWLTLALWIISSITAAIINNPDVSTALIIFFPFVFGIFFLGYAFTMLFPKAFVQSYFGKLAFDILFLAAFFAWGYLSLKKKKEYKIAIRILLGLIFFVFFLGFVGCAVSLA